MILLGSNSPRRKELLAGLNIDYTVVAMPDVDESYSDTFPIEEVPAFLAQKKADEYIHLLIPDDFLITADTVVIAHGEILGKPSDREDACRMLRSLSGAVHKVITGVCITGKAFRLTFDESTKVEFERLTEEEINFYVDRYQPFDKAGAYGIQEWIGYAGIKRIEGSFYNVMGLPVCRLYKELKRINESLPTDKKIIL